jgi:hypothetical protein
MSNDPWLGQECRRLPMKVGHDPIDDPAAEIHAQTAAPVEFGLARQGPIRAAYCGCSPSPVQLVLEQRAAA